MSEFLRFDPPSSDTYARLKEGVRWMWSLGDYTALAARLRPYAEALAEAAALGPGEEVLDVAAGDGNLAIAAAARGATVTAIDLTPRMVELGRARTAAEGVAIDWMEADAEALPFPAGRFDVVASVFGAVFAPRPERVAAELFRVVRPGGLVAMANYGEDGFLGRVGKLLAQFGPPAPVALPSPFQWGDPEEVRRRFAGLAASIEARRRTGRFAFTSLDEALAFWERTNGPLTALRSLVPETAYVEVRAALRRLFAELAGAGDGELTVEWDYLLVLARAPRGPGGGNPRPQALNEYEGLS